MTENIASNFTSDGSKFWKHPEQMNNYRNGNPNTIISTHISPTSQCNLGCSYCSVKKRKPNQIELETIRNYVKTLMTKGLRAVILTGGGEPTLYPQFNELVRWLKREKGLSVGLITNGTNSESVEDWWQFSWVRVSINTFRDWTSKINLPLKRIPESVVIGASFIDDADRLEKNIEDLKWMAEKLRATYIRVLPNCLLPADELEAEHKRIDEIFERYHLSQYKFFHQYKKHEPNNFQVCHQAYFRPYLSEVNGGTVYPCDSIVLNDQVRYFHNKYQICKAEDALEFLDRKIQMKFKPCDDCSGCVFTKNLQLLEDWGKGKLDRFEEFKSKNFIHEDFV